MREERNLQVDLLFWFDIVPSS